MRAILLAGGMGTRLHPYTTLIPKPLVPLGGKYSIMEIIIKQLKVSGFTHITVAVNHLAHLIMSYFGDGSKWGLTIDYSIEDNPLGTIGPLKLIQNLPENFLVMNGDILCSLDYKKFFDDHVNQDAEISVSAYKRIAKIDFGTLTYDDTGHLTSFVEKPSYNFDVSMGVYCLNRNVVDRLIIGEFYGFDNLMHDNIKNNRKVRISPFSGFWLDIGRPEDYQTANENFGSVLQQIGLDL